ncbi:MAG: hypothetical protein HZA51_11735 [Planctomycetes bacterium]|nr:hypothetical protein [Planctomycetota bacterium]
MVVQSAHAGQLTPGNILISTEFDRRLYEYTRTGQLVQSYTVPYPVSPMPQTEALRDVFVTSDGLAHLYNGTFDPYLTTLNPLTNSWTHRTHTGWSTINNITYGGIGNYGQYIYTSDDNTGNGDDNLSGIIRFDMTNGTSERFADTFEPIDLTVGQDGLLYLLHPPTSSGGWALEVYDPVSLTHLNHIFFGIAGDHRAVAVNAAGEIYRADAQGNIRRYAPDATLINEINVCGISPGRCFLSDLDIAPDGTIIAGTTSGRVIMTNTTLSSAQLFPAIVPNNAIFVAFVPEPASAALFLTTAIGITSARPRRRKATSQS